MKALLISTLCCILIGFLSVNIQVKTHPEYQRGWKDGYTDGHHFKYKLRIGSIPEPPECNGDTCDYMKGYKLGIRKGYEDVIKIKTP